MSENRTVRDKVSDDTIFRMLVLPMRLQCVKDLLSGNDTQCFTTAQYMKRFIDREENDNRIEALRLLNKAKEKQR